jgi:hypothetical protein
MKDANFKWDSVDRIAAAARPVFALLNAANHLTIRHPESDHDFPDNVRFESYDLIQQVLGKP